MNPIPPASDQGVLNNCKAHAISYGFKAQFGLDFDVNWLMAIGTRRGAGINHMLDALMQYGALPVGEYSIEPAHPYTAREWAEKNESKYRSLAAKYKIKEYKKITSAADLLAAISGGWYVVITVTVPTTPRSYPVDADGVFRPYLAPGMKDTHAMSAWRVNPDGTIRVLNSWGTGWGENGQANMTAQDALRVDHCFAYRFDSPAPKPTPEPEKPKGSEKVREGKIVSGLPANNTAVVRAEKETTSEKVGNLKNGDAVLLLATEGNRALIATGLAGWIDKKYLVDILGETPEPEAPAEPAKPTEPFTPAPAGVHTYTDRQKDVRLTEHFTVGDFWAYPNHKKIKLDTTLAHILEKFYVHFGVRPLLRNKNLGTDKPYLPYPSAGYRDSLNWTGSKTSQHCYGRGLDFYIPGVAAYKLAQFAETLVEVGGIGLYLAKSGQLERVTHIHIDTRGNRARWGWNGQTSGTNTPGFGGIPCVFKYDKRNLQRSAAIEELQHKLNASGANCGTPDGVFGERTQTALMIYQSLRGMKADGIYGKDTNKVMGLFDW